MGQDRPALGAVDLAAGVECGQPPEAVLIDDGAGAGGQLGQAGAVGGGHRPDVAQARPGEVGEVGARVLPGVEHHRHLGRLLAAGSADRGVPGGHDVDHGGELGDVGLVAGVGVPGQRDAAVAGDDQAQAGQPQVGALLLGLAPLGDRGALVAGIDESGEVGHVQGDGGAVHAGRIDDGQRDPAGDLLQLLQADGVHRVPEPAVVQRRRADPGEPAGCRARPPVGEGQLGAGGDQAAQGGQRQVGARARARVRPPGPGDLVDDGGHAQVLQHAPGGGDRAEVLVLGTAGQPQPGAPHRAGQLLGSTQVFLRDDPRLAVHTGGLDQVVIGRVAAFLADDRCHIWVIHHSAR